MFSADGFHLFLEFAKDPIRQSTKSVTSLTTHRDALLCSICDATQAAITACLDCIGRNPTGVMFFCDFISFHRIQRLGHYSFLHGRE